MGDNKRSDVVGYGKHPPTHAASMPASCPQKPASCSIFSAYLTPNPNPHVLTGALAEVTASPFRTSAAPPDTAAVLLGW